MIFECNIEIYCRYKEKILGFFRENVEEYLKPLMSHTIFEIFHGTI